MADTILGRDSDVRTDEPEHHEYHSAVEVDETHENWRDWVGPTLAILALVGALVLLFLTGGGYI